MSRAVWGALMDFDQILPNLYVGSYPEDTSDIDRLHAAGITAVLSLQSEEDCDYLGLETADLAGRYASLGLETRRVSIRDFDDGDLRDKLPVAVETLAELLEDGHAGFVHCTAGVNRSPSVVICYLHWMLGWDLQRAAEHVTSCRRCDPMMTVIRQATDDWEKERS
jgi:hypothetical protein